MRTEMTADELAALIAQGRAPRIVDVRSPEKFAAGHLPGAVNIPAEELEEGAAQLDAATPTLLY
jgi:rhodanese-related sulfurtransferase